MATNFPIPRSFGGIHFIAKKLEENHIYAVLNKPIEYVGSELLRLMGTDATVAAKVRGAFADILPIVIFNQARITGFNSSGEAAVVNKPKLTNIGILFYGSIDENAMFKLPLSLSKVRGRDQIQVVRPGARETTTWINEPRNDSYSFYELVVSGRGHLNIMESVDTDLITPYIKEGFGPYPNDVYAASALQSRAVIPVGGNDEMEEVEEDEENDDDEDMDDPSSQNQGESIGNVTSNIPNRPASSHVGVPNLNIPAPGVSQVQQRTEHRSSIGPSRRSDMASQGKRSRPYPDLQHESQRGESSHQAGRPTQHQDPEYSTFKLNSVEFWKKFSTKVDENEVLFDGFFSKNFYNDIVPDLNGLRVKELSSFDIVHLLNHGAFILKKNITTVNESLVEAISSCELLMPGVR